MKDITVVELDILLKKYESVLTKIVHKDNAKQAYKVLVENHVQIGICNAVCFIKEFDECEPIWDLFDRYMEANNLYTNKIRRERRYCKFPHSYMHGPYEPNRNPRIIDLIRLVKKRIELIRQLKQFIGEL